MFSEKSRFSRTCALLTAMSLLGILSTTSARSFGTTFTCSNDFFSQFNPISGNINSSAQVAVTWLCANGTSLFPGASLGGFVFEFANKGSSGIFLGNFTEETSGGIFAFSGGEFCSALSSPRSGTLSLVCDATTDSQVDAEEVTTCRYAITIRSTSFCTASSETSTSTEGTTAPETTTPVESTTTPETTTPHPSPASPQITKQLGITTKLQTTNLLRKATTPQLTTPIENTTAQTNISTTALPTTKPTACIPGFYLTFASNQSAIKTCQPCPVGTCQNASGATTCIKCDPTDLFCRGEVCSGPKTTPFTGTTAEVSMIIPIPLDEFSFYMQLHYAWVIAEKLNRTLNPDWIRLKSLTAIDIRRRRLLAAATSMAFEMQIESEDCQVVQGLSAEKLYSVIASLGVTPPMSVTASTAGCPEISALTPELKAQATATTAVVAGVVAAVISTSVAGSVAGSMGGSMAAGAGGAAGASVYQLITATQFLNIFGKIIDQRGIPKTAPAGSRRAGIGNETVVTSGSGSAATSFSSSFGWANMRFDDIFAQRPNSCGGVYLQPFFGVFGTFITTLCGSFAIRAGLNYAMKKVVDYVNGEFPLKSIPGFRPGQYEFHVIKTAHLGLCQAAGSVISVAINRGPGCPCGWLVPAMWALAICWLICLPIGFILFSGARMISALKSRRIMFHTLKGGGSWSHYMGKVKKAEGSAHDVCKPTVIHAVIRALLGVGGCVCVFLGLRAATAKILVDSLVLFVVGVVLGFLSVNVKTSFGRKIVVAVTNFFAAAVGKVYVLDEQGAVQERARSVSTTAIGMLMLDKMGQLKCMLDIAADRGNLKLLRDRGRWLRKDNMKMFYVDYSSGGIYFSLFWMMKNLLIGVLLTDEPVLVESLVKAWVIFIMYLIEFIILAFFSPDCDAFNGAKMAFQSLQQLIIIFIGALTVSNAISLDSGTNACIQLSIIQVSLAIPEQMWGLLKNTVLRKNGPPKEPDFKMTAEELAIQKEINDLGLTAKYQAARDSVLKLRALVPVMKKGDIKELLLKIVTDKELLLKLNAVKPGCLLPLFREVFCGETIHDGLLEFADTMPLIAPHIRSLAENEWETSVDFHDGVQCIFSIKDMLESILNMGLAIKSMEFNAAIQDFLSCGPLLLCLTGLIEESETPISSVAATMKALFEFESVQKAITVAKSEVKDFKVREFLEKLDQIKIENTDDVRELITTVTALSNWKPLDTIKPSFSFSKDILSYLEIQDAVTILQQLGADIPEPARSLFNEAIESVAVVPSIKKVVDKIWEFDLMGSLEVIFCSRELVPAIERLVPGAIYPVLRTIFDMRAITTAIAECKPNLPADLRVQLETLVTLKYESPLDVQMFVEAISALVSYVPVDEVKCPFSFSRDVIHRLNERDAVKIIKQIGGQIPEPAASLFAKALEVLDLLPVVNKLIDRVRSLDLPGALKVVLCSPDFLEDFDSMIPGAIYPVLNSAVSCEVFQTAIAEIQRVVPEVAQRLDPLRTLRFNGPPDLGVFIRLLRDLDSGTAINEAKSAFSFAKDVVSKFDSRTAIVVLQRLGDNVPEPGSSLLKKVWQGLDLLPAAKGMADFIQANKFGEAVEMLLCSSEFLRGLEHLSPGFIYPVLRSIVRSEPVSAAANITKGKKPELSQLLHQLSQIPFGSPGDLEDFIHIMHEEKMLDFAKEIVSQTDEKSTIEVFTKLRDSAPAPAKRIFETIMPRKGEAFKAGQSAMQQDDVSRISPSTAGIPDNAPIDSASGNLTVGAHTLSSAMVYIETKDELTHKIDSSAQKQAVKAGRGNAEVSSSKERDSISRKGDSMTSLRARDSTGSVKGGKANSTINFLRIFVRIISKLDPEQAIRVIEKIEDAIPEPAQVVTEDGFDALYEVASAACEMKEGLKDHDHDDELSAPVSGSPLQARDPEAPRPQSAGGEVEEAKKGLVQTVKEEPEWLIFILMGVLGVATIIIFGVISNSNDCGCTCRV